MMIKLFTAILVCRIDCVCTLAPVYTILWKFFSNRGYKGWYNEVSHIISLTNYINGKLSLCQGQWAFTSLQCSYFGLFYLIEFKAFSDFNAIVLLSGIIVYLLKKYIFYCFWNNLFDNLTSSCIVIVYRSEQQIKFWWLVEFLI